MSNPIEDSDNINLRMTPTSRQSLIGRVRTCSSLTTKEWTLITFSMLTIVYGFGFSIYRFVTITSDSPDMVLGLLVCLNLCFAIFYCMHGILQEQPFEMLTLALTTFFIWILIIVSYLANLGIQLKLIRFLISSVLTVPTILLCFFVGRKYWQSGNLVFRTVGGDIRLQRLCRQLFFTYSLLTLDLQATFSSFLLVFHKGIPQETSNDVAILIFGIIYSIVWVSIGYIAIRTENIRLTWVFGTASVLQPIYVIFLLSRATDDMVAAEVKYSVLSASAFISGTSLTLSHFSLLAMLIVVSHNYGKGLSEKVYGNPSPNRLPSTLPSGPETSSQDPLLPGSNQPFNYDAIIPIP